LRVGGPHCIHPFDDAKEIATMRTGQDDYETSVEDAAPVDMLAALFEARGWAHEIVSADEISAEIQGSWTSYQVRAIWRADDNVLQLLCLPDIRVSDDKRRAAHELLALVNEQLWLGHFDVWSQGGMLLGDEGLLGLGQAQGLIETAVDECDRFYPAFQFVLWGDKSPQDALASAMVDAAGEA
jgi:hypothetical protein